MKHIQGLCMASGIKVMFVGFQGLSASPLHVLDQLLEAALNLTLSLRGFVDVADGLCDVPVARLVDISIDLRRPASGIPTVFAVGFGGKGSALLAQKERDLREIDVPSF